MCVCVNWYAAESHSRPASVQMYMFTKYNWQVQGKYKVTLKTYNSWKKLKGPWFWFNRYVDRTFALRESSDFVMSIIRNFGQLRCPSKFKKRHTHKNTGQIHSGEPFWGVPVVSLLDWHDCYLWWFPPSLCHCYLNLCVMLCNFLCRFCLISPHFLCVSVFFFVIFFLSPCINTPSSYPLALIIYSPTCCPTLTLTLKPPNLRTFALCVGFQIQSQTLDNYQPIRPNRHQHLFSNQKFFFGALLTDSDESESDSTESVSRAEVILISSDSDSTTVDESESEASQSLLTGRICKSTNPVSHSVPPLVTTPIDPSDPTHTPHLSASNQLLEHSDSETQDPNAEQLAPLNDSLNTLFPFDFTLPPIKPRLRFRMPIPPPDPSEMPLKLPFGRTIYPHHDDEEEESSSCSSSYIPSPPPYFFDDSTSSD